MPVYTSRIVTLTEKALALYAQLQEDLGQIFVRADSYTPLEQTAHLLWKQVELDREHLKQALILHEDRTAFINQQGESGREFLTQIAEHVSMSESMLDDLGSLSRDRQAAQIDRVRTRLADLVDQVDAFRRPAEIADIAAVPADFFADTNHQQEEAH